MTRILSEEQKARKREREKLWRAENPEKVAAKNRRYSEAHPEVQREYYQKNATRRRDYAKAYALVNLDYVRAKSVDAYYRRKLAGLLIRGSCKEKARIRNARRRTSDDKLPTNYVVKLLALQRGRCGNCRKKVGGKYHLDHIRAVSLGGKTVVGNMEILCPTCNLRKHAKDQFVWARENGRLL